MACMACMACTVFDSLPAAKDRLAAPRRRSCSRIGGRSASATNRPLEWLRGALPQDLTPDVPQTSAKRHPSKARGCTCLSPQSSAPD
jgi:hypothetical protein